MSAIHFNQFSYLVHDDCGEMSLLLIRLENDALVCSEEALHLTCFI